VWRDDIFVLIAGTWMNEGARWMLQLHTDNHSFVKTVSAVGVAVVDEPLSHYSCTL